MIEKQYDLTAESPKNHLKKVRVGGNKLGMVGNLKQTTLF